VNGRVMSATATAVYPDEPVQREAWHNPPVSQICALTVLLSTLMLLVANSTPIVDFDSRLNSLRVKRDSTGG